MKVIDEWTDYAEGHSPTPMAIIEEDGILRLCCWSSPCSILPLGPWGTVLMKRIAELKGKTGPLLTCHKSGCRPAVDPVGDSFEGATWFARCSHCNREGPAKDSDAAAMAAWNRMIAEEQVEFVAKWDRMITQEEKENG